MNHVVYVIIQTGDFKFNRHCSRIKTEKISAFYLVNLETRYNNCDERQRHSVHVGGEFYYDQAWQAESPVIATGDMTFLSGGKACLSVISEYLLRHEIRRVLLPSYLCPTIVNTLEKAGLACGYYRVNADLTINLDDLARKAQDYRAL